MSASCNSTGAKATSGGRAGLRQCLALCTVLVGLLATAPGAGAATYNLQSVPSPHGPNGQGFSVSCSSSTSCIAVGFFIDSLGEQRPLSQVWNGTSWTVKPVPLPSGVPVGYLRGVSCTSASACTAVGGAGFNDFPSQPLAERWNGTSWSIQDVPTPPGQFEVTFNAVSCATVTACTAVGSANDGTHSVAVAEGWDGTSWTVQGIQNPTGAAQIQLNGVACAGTGCFAVGHYTSSSANFFPDKILAERWNGSTWTIQATPLPSGTTDARLSAVSCSAFTACTAVGGYSTTNTFPNKTLAERWNGTNWAVQTTPNPAAGSPELSGVSCPTATDCTAVGVPAGFGAGTLAEQWNGTIWTIQSAATPSGKSQAQLSAVSCSAATACTAVGGATSSLQVPPSMLAERSNASSWAIQATPNQPGALVSAISGVSCASATSCFGVGSFISSDSKTRMLAEAWNGTRWSLLSVPSPSTTKGFLNAVSCTSATACTAVGSYLTSSGMVALAERWNGTSWAVQSTPSPSGSTNAALQGVSCPTATSCMAVGKFFNSTTNRWTRLAEQWNGTSWVLKSTQNASGETFSTLTGVSCASSAACTAVGGYAVTTGPFQANKLLAEQWNGTSWAIKATPSPTGTTFADFTGVSCSAASACTAAGGFATTSGAEFPSAPLAERWNGTSWALQTTPNPASEGFAGSSCPAATSCAAVGSSFAEGWNGVTWATQSISTLTIGEVELAGVSCSAVNACTAGGRSVQNYLIAPLFANSIFINAMNVPVAERDPAASSNRTPGRVSTPGPPASVKRSQIAHLLR